MSHMHNKGHSLDLMVCTESLGEYLIWGWRYSLCHSPMTAKVNVAPILSRQQRSVEKDFQQRYTGLQESLEDFKIWPDTSVETMVETFRIVLTELNRMCATSFIGKTMRWQWEWPVRAVPPTLWVRWEASHHLTSSASLLKFHRLSGLACFSFHKLYCTVPSGF